MINSFQTWNIVLLFVQSVGGAQIRGQQRWEPPVKNYKQSQRAIEQMQGPPRRLLCVQPPEGVQRRVSRFQEKGSVHAYALFFVCCSIEGACGLQLFFFAVSSLSRRNHGQNVEDVRDLHDSSMRVPKATLRPTKGDDQEFAVDSTRTKVQVLCACRDSL